MDAAAVYEVLLCDGTRDVVTSSVMRRVNEGIYFAVMVPTYYQILNYFFISVELNSSCVSCLISGNLRKELRYDRSVKEVTFSEVDGSFMRAKNKRNGRKEKAKIVSKDGQKQQTEE